MNIIKEQTGDLTATLKVEITESDYKASYQDELKKYARQASIPGFRPGKVPVGMIERKYGTGIMLETINKLMNDELNKYIQDEKLNILGDPVPNSEKGKIDFEMQKDFEFYFDICQMPEINIDLDESLELDYYVFKATDEQIDKAVEFQRMQQGNDVEIEEVIKDAEVEFDLRRLDADGAAADEGDFFPCKIKLDDKATEYAVNQLLGKKANDILVIDPVELFGSAEAAAKEMSVDKSELADKKGIYQMKITFVQRREPAELNQEFYDVAFPEKGITSLDEAREEIGKQFSAVFQHDGDDFLVEEFFTWLYSNVKVDLPDEFLKKWLYFVNEGKFTESEIEKELSHVKASLTRDLVDNRLKTLYPEIVITTSLIKDEIKGSVRKYFTMSDEPGDEETEKSVEKFASDWMKDSKNEENIKQRKDLLYKTRVVELVKEKATLNRKEVTQEEFYSILADKYKAMKDNHHHDHDHDHDHNHDHDHDHKH